MRPYFLGGACIGGGLPLDSHDYSSQILPLSRYCTAVTKHQSGRLRLGKWPDIFHIGEQSVSNFSTTASNGGWTPKICILRCRGCRQNLVYLYMFVVMSGEKLSKDIYLVREWMIKGIGVSYQYILIKDMCRLLERNLLYIILLQDDRIKTIESISFLPI